ncbi:MAG: xylulokinase [Armatimonadetes bacterium]|nr:xylulokinase [Armatimonadota bacterium]
MNYLLGIDIGTSGTKALLISASNGGAVVASSTKTYPLYTPKPLWAEQEPEDWWQATIAAIRDVIDESGVDPKTIKGMGLSGQMHGSVFLDADNQVLRPAILWCDQRTQAECDWIMDTVGRDKVIELISNPVLTGFTAGKIIWLRNNEPWIYEQVKKVLLPKDYVRLRLTGEFATEVSDASGTALFNVTRRDWAYEMLDAIGIPKDWMPKAYESPEVSGKISAEAAALTGLKEGMPVVGGGGDQAAGAVGNGIVEAGIISSTVGTSGVVFAFADKPVVDPKLRAHTFCHAVPGKWHVMGAMLSAGGSLRWYRDTFADAESTVAKALGKDPYEVMCREAVKAPAGCEGLIFLPYLTGERTPYPDPHARGAFFGITLRSDRAHFVRSVLEGVAYGLRDSFSILEEMKVPITQVRASGGGARSDVWRQIQADITGYDHVTINIDEGPALGVALLAGVGTGIYPSVEKACRSVINVATSTPADREAKAVYDKYYTVYQSLYQSLKGDFERVSKITAG